MAFTPLTPVEIWKALKTQYDVNFSINEIRQAMNQIDQEAIFQAERNRITIEVWDEESPINGVPAEQIKARGDIPAGGKVYLLYVDGNLMILQPHNPFSGGVAPLTKGNVLTIAEQHADMLAMDWARPKIVDAVLEKLLGG